MENCIFCKIINKEIPARVVYENEHVIAFHDIAPVAPVHVLVVPKVHVENVMDPSDATIVAVSEVHKAVREIAKLLGIGEKGFRLITNNGKDAGQTVFHLHYHLIAGVTLGEKLI